MKVLFFFYLVIFWITFKHLQKKVRFHIRKLRESFLTGTDKKTNVKMFRK